MKSWLINSIALVLITIIGGILYHLGGTKGWNTKVRDFGVPTCQLVLFLIWCFPIYTLQDLSLILTFGSIFAVQTTYWKKKGTDAQLYNWLFTGIGYSICWLPTVLIQNIWHPTGISTHWLGFALRSLICTGLTVCVSEVFGNVVMEENARGWVEVITVPLLFIGG